MAEAFQLDREALLAIMPHRPPSLLLDGVLRGDAETVIDVAKRIKDALSGGPHLVNLGYGATPDADAAYVEIPLKAI